MNLQSCFALTVSPSVPPEKIYPQWRLLLSPALLMAALVCASSFAPVSPASPDIVHFDKIAHFCVFGLLGTLFFRVQRSGFFERKRWLVSYFLVLAFGVLDELLQIFNPHRSFDPYDWLADGTGPLLALYLYRNWKWYRVLLERRLFAWLAKGRS